MRRKDLASTFNISDWGGERLAGDKRWQYGTPPSGNAKFVWVRQNGPLTTNSYAEGC